MAHGREIYDPELGRPRCTANSRQTGQRCRQYPRPGAAVCRYHGAQAPQVIRSARRRLLDAVDPALDALIRPLEIVSTQAEAEIEADGRISGETLDLWLSLRHNADAILDRTGYPRRTEVDLGDARSRVLERLRAEAAR